MINRVIKRNEPKKHIFKDASDTFFRDNPDVDVATICIYEGKPKRSDAQHKLYFAWRDICQKEWYGYGIQNKDDLHKFFKDELNNGKSTKELTVEEFVEFLDKVDNFARDRGVMLPRTNSYAEAMYGKT